MKKKILLLLMLCMSFYLYSQVKMPASGDMFYYQVDKSPDKKSIPAKGKVKFWDFGFLQSPYIITYKAAAVSKKGFVPEKSNLMLTGSNDVTNFYQVAKTSFALAGFSSEDPFGIGYRADIDYTNPLRENLAGLKMDKLITEVTETYVEFGIDNIKDAFLKKLPVLPDSIRLNVLITRKNKVDGLGKLFLPDITLTDCIRVTREETYDYTIDTKTGHYKWIDASDVFRDNINELPAGKTEILFYNARYILPVLKLSVDNNEQTITKAEYYVPAKTAQLKDKPSGQPDITLYPNPAYTKNVKLELSNIPAGRYTFKMYSLIGKLEKSIPYYINGSKFDTIDISDLKPGIYIYALVDGAGKIIQSKRLTIISP